MRIGALVAVLAFAFATFVPWGRAGAGVATGRAALRVGVFDSRAIAIAYGRSPACATRFQALHDEYEKAKAANMAARWAAMLRARM